MILKQCEEIEGKIEELGRLRKIAEEIEAYNSRRENLSQMIRSLRKPVEILSVFKEKDIGVIYLTYDLKEVTNQLQQVKKDFSEEPSTILEKNKLKQLSQETDKLIQEMEEQFQEVWESYKVARLITVNEELLIVLEKIPGFKDIVNKVRKINNDIRIHYANYPQKIVDVENFQKRAADLKKYWESLGSENIPKSVWYFLKLAVSHRGAPLDTINPEVLNWLQQNQVKGSFRVKVGG